MQVPSNKPQRGWVWPAAVVGGLAAVLVCAALVTLIAGGAWLWRSLTTETVALNATPSSATTRVAAQPADPQSGVLNNVRGLVEVQSPDGQWTQAQDGQTVRAGQRVRTGALSSVTLSFYDGSQARLGPQAEVSVDTLDAQKSGPRVILLTQTAGESDHTVAKSSDPASRYEVNTPSGAGRAKGTEFHVVIIVGQFTRFDVDEGAIEVINLDVTIVVVAGQSTIVLVGQAPQPPVFRIEGEGEVERIGNVWRIAGYSFLTNANTVIVGNPDVGDWVAFEGHFLPDGSRFADSIVFLHPLFQNRIVFTGEVEAMGDVEWTIAGRQVRVDGPAIIEPGITLGDVVEVRGGVAADGEIWATTIQRITPDGFQFTGVAQTISPTVWTVSGISVTVNVSTTIEAGIEVGDLVVVKGQILENGTWLATSIEPAETETFDFVGVVISQEPWVIGGILIETDEHTQVDDEVEIGNRARVRGRVLPDGTWLADSIEQVDEGRRHHVQFTARVESINPWVVGHVSVTVDSQTQIIGDIQVGDWATVKGNLQPDGTVLAKKITLVQRALGCVTISTVVKSVDASQLVLFDGQTVSLSDAREVEGAPLVASVLLIHVCIDEDGVLDIIRIVVISQLDEVPVIVIQPPAQPPGDEDDDDDGGGRSPLDCKEGPGLGLGHCKHRHRP